MLDGDEQLLLVVTQFHTFGVELKRKFSVGAATTKLAVGVLVAIAVFFVYRAPLSTSRQRATFASMPTRAEGARITP